MIEDQELRSLFKAESEEHLQTLESGLLRLEADPEDTAVLEDLFRSAHSLKGAARMLGVAGLEMLAHHFEDELGAARRGNRPISSEGADRLYRGLDAMRQLASEACTGDDAKVDLAEVFARLHGEGISEANDAQTKLIAVKVGSESRDVLIHPSNDQTSVPTVPSPPAEGRLPADNRAVTDAAVDGVPTLLGIVPTALARDSMAVGEEDHVPASVTTFKIETIRVEPQKLDVLTTLAEEMVVTTARTVRALSVIGDLNELCEEWTRDASSSASAFSQNPAHPLPQEPHALVGARA